MQKRFGSWNKALELSGLAVEKRKSIPHKELLDDLKRVAELLATETISTLSYRSLGKFSDVTIARAFGSWVKALAAAGLSVSPAWRPKATEEELLSNMASVWEKIGKQPKERDFRPPLSRFSPDAYVRRYGSWRKALEHFVAAANGDRIHSEPETEPAPPPTIPISENKRRTSREPGWRLRFLVFLRDRFTCKSCGKTPALDPGTQLHADHILPWSKGGETILENLQTLCHQCNIGKGDLFMNDEKD
jgi:5-methylcytosine-specific restriction endonuclease McrA